MDFYRQLPLSAYFGSCAVLCGLLLGGCGSGQKRGESIAYNPYFHKAEDWTAHQASISPVEKNQTSADQTPPPAPVKFWTSETAGAAPNANGQPSRETSSITQNSRNSNAAVPEKLLERATVRDWRWDMHDRKLALVESLEMRCPDGFDFGKPKRTEIPQVSCRFLKPINDTSFVCEFQFEGKPIALKVEADSTVARTEMAVNELSRLMGFAHATSCPAVVTCSNCEQKGFKQYANTSGFVQMGYPGKAVTPQAIPWTALKKAGNPTHLKSSLETETLLAEREAFLLWQSLVGPAEDNNFPDRLGFQLVCDKDCENVTIVPANDLSTRRPANWSGQVPIYSHQIESWLTQKTFSEGNQKCQLQRALASSEHNEVSEEGRKWLLDHMRTVSRANLQDLFALARFPEKSGTPALWATGFYEKAIQIDQIARQSGSCIPLAQKKSILAEPTGSQ